MVQKDILRLQVSVDDAVLVETTEGFDELGRVETGSPLTKLLVLAQMVEELATVQEVHHEVEFGGRLESILELYDERAVDLLKDVTLSCV